MKFGFISLDFRRYPLEFCFQMAQRYGFDGLEIWAGRPHAFPGDMDPGAIAEINDWKKKYGVEVPMYTANVLGGNYRITATKGKERQEAVELYKRHIDVAKAIKAPAVLVVADHPGYMIDPYEAWEALADSMMQLCDYAEGTGVKVVIEPLTPMESPLICTADDCVRLFRDVGHDNLEAMMDVVPPVVCHEPFSEYFVKLGKRMNYIHICNTDGRSDAHTRLEEGVIPIRDMFAVFKNWDYGGYVTAELYSEGYHDPELFLSNTARILGSIRDELSI
jgi:protein FrlC